MRARVSDGSFATKSDLVFLGVHAPLELSQVARAKRAFAPAGGLWIVRQKGKGPVPEGEVRAAAHGAGLVDVKVCAFSPTHTADKFVIPVAARKRAK